MVTPLELQRNCEMDSFAECDRFDKDERCPTCGLRWQYLSGQRYCPTCEAEVFFLKDVRDFP